MAQTESRVGIPKQNFKFFAFVSDQIIHIAIIIVTFALLRLDAHTNGLYKKIADYKYINDVILYIFLFVVIWDPASVFIKKLFELISSNNSPANEGELKNG